LPPPLDAVRARLLVERASAAEACADIGDGEPRRPGTAGSPAGPPLALGPPPWPPPWTTMQTGQSPDLAPELPHAPPAAAHGTPMGELAPSGAPAAAAQLSAGEHGDEEEGRQARHTKAVDALCWASCPVLTQCSPCTTAHREPRLLSRDPPLAVAAACRTYSRRFVPCMTHRWSAPCLALSLPAGRRPSLPPTQHCRARRRHCSPIPESYHIPYPYTAAGAWPGGPCALGRVCGVRARDRRRAGRRHPGVPAAHAGQPQWQRPVAVVLGTRPPGRPPYLASRGNQGV